MCTISAEGNTVIVADTSTAPPVLVSVPSRKVRRAGTFDLPLALICTDPRKGASHTIVMTFGKIITDAVASVVEGAATAAPPTFSGNDAVIAFNR